MAEPYVIKMPQLSDTMTEGVVVGWEKQVGDKVARGDVVAIVETDKAIMDVEALHEGYLSAPIAAIDSTVAVGEALALLVESADAVQGAVAPSAVAVAEPAPHKADADEATADRVVGDSHADRGVPVGLPGGRHTITMPQFSDTMREGVVVGWEKQAGDRVECGDVVAIVETDKAIMDVEAPHAGFLSGPLAPLDAPVAVGEPLASLVDDPARVTHETAVVSGATAGAPRAAAATGSDGAAQPVNHSAIPAGDWDYDVVVIGAGPGGEDCARDLAGHGLRVALVNDAPLPGGECLWRGCIPSKAWRAAADRIRDRAFDATMGVEGTNGAITLDWGQLEAHRRGVLEERGRMALNTDRGVKIKVIQGFASFESDHTLFIDTSGNADDPHRRAPQGDGASGETVSFGCAVVATGAPPFVPPIPGAREGVATGGVLTSDTVWNLPGVPTRLGVVGGGAIGMEMAQIFQDFGTEVVLLERSERVLAEVEPEIAKNLIAALEQDPNLTIVTNAATQAVEGEPGAMVLVYTDGAGVEQRFACDYVLMATGKRPALEPLRLEQAGVAVENGVIRADDRCRTSVPHIFAVGDVIGGLMLAHTAGQQGRVAAANIIGEAMAYDQDKDSGVIFTRPEAGFVGLSLAQAKAQGIDAVEVKVPLSIDAKAMISGERHGLIKIVADKASHRIVGVHLLADHTDTLIGEAVMLVSAEMTLEQLAGAIHPHPTQTELFGELARRLLSRLRRSKRK